MDNESLIIHFPFNKTVFKSTSYLMYQSSSTKYLTWNSPSNLLSSGNAPKHLLDSQLKLTSKG